MAYSSSSMMGTESLFRRQNGRSVALTTHALSRFGIKKREQLWAFINPLKPNDLKKRRTAQLTSRRYILYIYSTNIGTEYFKHAA